MKEREGSKKGESTRRSKGRSSREKQLARKGPGSSVGEGECTDQEKDLSITTK